MRVAVATIYAACWMIWMLDAGCLLCGCAHMIYLLYLLLGSGCSGVHHVLSDFNDVFGRCDESPMDLLQPLHLAPLKRRAHSVAE
jgi:hypothetical protein